MYFVVVESKESDGFIIGDCYPVVVTGDNIHLYSIYPISSKRAVMLESNGAEYAPRCVTRFRECILKQAIKNTDTITIRVKGLYKEEVQFINTEIEKNLKEGFVFKKV